jgi:hypothetical protein
MTLLSSVGTSIAMLSAWRTRTSLNGPREVLMAM